MILCCGEALIDMLPGQASDGRRAFVPCPGGAVFNTAIALGRLGSRVGMLSGISTDMFGTMLLAELDRSRVDTSCIAKSDRPTTLAFVQLKDGKAEYSFFDENSAGRMLRKDDLTELPTHVSALFFGGISLACEPSAETYAALCMQYAGQLPIMLDPNIRPRFIVDEARYRDRLARMMAVASIVKLSDEDAEWLYPDHDGLDDCVGSLLALGPEVAVVTKGSAGAEAWTRSGIRCSVPAHQAPVVDTVGAGDAFNAGLLAKLDQTDALRTDRLEALTMDDLKACLTFGADVAARTVAKEGADPPWLEDLSAT